MNTIRTAVDHIFAACPELWAFSFEDETELKLSEVETHPWIVEPERVLGEIAEALRELVDEHPEAVEALRGRTFARKLH